MDSTKLYLDDIGMSVRRFGMADYIVFVLMLLICTLIGVYFGFLTGKAQTALDYLMGGRNMQTFPVALSLIASFLSGITLLGLPTEIYLYGTQYLYSIISVICMGVAISTAYLPVFHELKLTSTYEYLERRFNKQVRLFGSLLFIIDTMLWLPIVIYVPALAFNQVTGINIHIITLAVCIVCIFYTCVGGLKAVVYTDVVQTLVMFAAMILVMVKGTIDIGGLGFVWRRNYETGRIEAPDFSLDPTVRHSILTLLVGGFFWWLQLNAVNQNMVQRYLALPTVYSARISLSTGLNSMATVLLEDFCKTCLKLQMSSRWTNIFLKTIVVVLGSICIAMVIIVEKLGSVLQMTISLNGLSNGPSLGIFSMGLFLPWINSTGALIGGIGGLAFMAWITIGTQAAIASGDISLETKPLSVDGCTYDFANSSLISAFINSTAPHQKDEVFILYQMSYLWYTLLGALVSILVGLVASFITNPTNPASVDSMLVSPLIRRYLPKKRNVQDVDTFLLKEHKTSNGTYEDN